MIHLRKLVSVVCWAWLLSSYSVSINAANLDPTTGNLLNLTGTPTATTGNWVNGVYVTSLTCWEPGDPGNCGPNPSVYRNYNLINFSYGAVDLHQVVNINAALKAAGNNLQLTGFNFGFMAKNGNGWDNGQQDYLSAYVKFYKSNGSLAANYDYTQYTNAQYNWRTFNFSETFRNPSWAASYSAAQFGFIGKDTNNLAGPYGPEIQGVNFNLKYRVDPCATDPTSSPACPKFSSAISAKNTLPVPIDSTPVVETAIVNTVPTMTHTASKSQIDSTLVRPQSKNVSMALSLIAKNQQQTRALENATAQTAISEAAMTADNAQQQAMAVATSLTTMSQQPVSASMSTSTISNNDTKSTISITPNITAPRVTPSATSSASVTTNVANVDTQQTTIPALQSYFKTQTTTTQSVQEPISSIPLQPPNNNSKTVASTQPIATISSTSVFSQQFTDNQQQANIVTAYIQPQNTMFYTMSVAPVEQQQQPTVQAVNFTRQTEIEQVSSTAGFMTNRTDPLNEVVETKSITTAANTTESNQKVKTNVAANELAGNVDINKMATTPVGYSNYTNLVLKDGKMYEPKEIYKNQVPVDNARALRQLSTDRLHQQMIEQQYRR